MRFLPMVLLIAFAVFAYDPDAGPDPGGLQYSQAGSDDWSIVLTSQNVYPLNFGSSLRGCDYADGYGELLMSDYGTDSIYSVDPTTGMLNAGIPCPPEIPDVLGLCHYVTTENNILINDWGSVLDIWRWGSTSWWEYMFGNPSPEPRGMDMDDAQTVWEIDANSRVLYHFDLSGNIIDSFALTELPSSYACGCSVFPFAGQIGIVIGGYAYADFYFYLYDGSSLEYMNSAPVPQSISSSYGISWSCDTGSFFWVYTNTSGDYYLCEFTADIQELALEQSTWGGIKSVF